MAYKTKDLMDIAIEAIKKNRLVFIEDIIAYLPCHKSTFYEHFPNESDGYKTLVTLLENNRTELKVSMRAKWYKSPAPALQMALMKLIATDDERRALSLSFSEVRNEVTHKLLTLDPLEDGRDDDTDDASAS